MFSHKHRTGYRPPAIAASFIGLIAATLLSAGPVVAQVLPPEPMASAATANGSPSADQNGTDEKGVNAAVSALHQLQARFHESISGGGNIDELMSLWTDDAAFTAGGRTYNGKDEIRAFFLQSPGFTNNWVSMSPLFKTQFNVHGRTASIYFECHFVDWQADPEVVVSHTSLTGMAKKVHGHWLFWNVTASATTLTP